MYCTQQRQMELIFDQELDGSKRVKKVHLISLDLKTKTKTKDKLRKKISKLVRNYIIIEDQKLVQDEICLFYCNLYKTKCDKSDCDFLFEKLDEDIKKLDVEDKHILEEELTVIEIEKLKNANEKR